MKSIKSDGPCEPEITYPRLMLINNGSVVLITKAYDTTGSGVLVHRSKTGPYKVGYWSETWSMKFLKPYNGSVCLEN